MLDTVRENARQQLLEVRGAAELVPDFVRFVLKTDQIGHRLLPLSDLSHVGKWRQNPAPQLSFAKGCLAVVDEAKQTAFLVAGGRLDYLQVLQGLRVKDHTTAVSTEGLWQVTMIDTGGNDSLTDQSVFEELHRHSEGLERKIGSGDIRQALINLFVFFEQFLQDRRPFALRLASKVSRP